MLLGGSKANLDPGQSVNRGQVLMTLNAKDLKTELAHMREQLVAAENERKIAVGGGSPEEIAQLDSDLAKTNAEIDRLRSERDSLERLYAQQAATRQEVEQAKTALSKAEADKRLIVEKRSAILERAKPQAERATLRIEEARNSIQSLEEKLKAAQVTAPAGGTVYSRSALDANSSVTPTQRAFYGPLATYQSNQTAYDAGVAISTPITADAAPGTCGDTVAGSIVRDCPVGLNRAI